MREIRVRSLLSLFYFSKVVLGFRLITPSLHLLLCLSLQRLRTKQVWELPRGHFKTTVASKSYPVWLALPMTDSDVDYAIRTNLASETEALRFQSLHDPNLRILLVSGVDENAKKILRSTRYQFEQNQILRGVWPEVLPESNAKWNDSELCLKRSLNFSESTFEAIGVGNALQSRHYDLIIEDDLVGKEAADSETVMKRVIEYHVLLEGAYDRPETASSLVIGNRWSFSDLNSWIRENEPEYEFHTRSAIEDGQSIFPERFSVPDLRRIERKQGSYVYSCQYLNNPIAPGAHDFEPEWLKRFKLIEELDANGRKTKRLVAEDNKSVFFDQLNRFILIDPAREGKSSKARNAVLVVGVDKDDNHWIIRTWAEKTSTDRMMQRGFEFYETYRAQKCGIEGYGGDAHLKNYMAYKARTEHKRMNLIVFNKSTTKSKEERIRACQPRFETGKVYLIDTDTEFFNEYISFPSGVTVDLLDAYSHSDEICRRPVSEQETEHYRSVIRKLESNVNERTGY